MMFNLPWHHSTRDIHDKANVELIFERIQKLNQRFLERCDYADNPFINNLNANSFQFDS